MPFPKDERQATLAVQMVSLHAVRMRDCQSGLRTASPDIVYTAGETDRCCNRAQTTALDILPAPSPLMRRHCTAFLTDALVHLDQYQGRRSSGNQEDPRRG